MSAFLNATVTWRQSLELAAVLVGLATLLWVTGRRRARAVAPFLREAGIVAVLYAFWQLVGMLATRQAAGAVARGAAIAHAETAIGLPSERRVQALVLSQHAIRHAAEVYYASVHFAAMGVLLLWVFTRHRGAYPRVRLVVVLVTLSSLLIQLLPVAPPRLVPSLGIVDIAAHDGLSVYAAGGGVGADQLSAMPSVHIGWAVIIAVSVLTISPSRWRWLILLDPAATLFAVTVTGNHYYADGAVAALLVALAWVVSPPLLRAAAALRDVLRTRLQQTGRRPAADGVPALRG